MTRRPTVADLLALKGVRQLLTLHVDNVDEAKAAAAVGIDMVNCEVDWKLPLIRTAAPLAFVTSGYPHGHIASEESAIRAGFHAMAQGTDTLYFDGSMRLVEAMAREGIPVTGHVGLVPGWSTWTNFRAIGKTTEEAVAMYHKLKAYEDAGAWSVELECVPVEIADFLTRSTTLITQGMGSGAVCDTQFLFSCDVLGTNTGKYPRHAKKYADFAQEEDRLQRLRVAAFTAFAEDVRSATYPALQHEVHVSEDVLEGLERAIQARRGS